jgi:hypothetical protein
VTNCEKVVLFGFSTGTKGEKLKCYSSNIQNSPLVPVQNPKSTTFSHLVTVLSPQEIEEIKKDLFWVFDRFKDLIFGPKKILHIF